MGSDAAIDKLQAEVVTLKRALRSSEMELNFLRDRTKGRKVDGIFVLINGTFGIVICAMLVVLVHGLMHEPIESNVYGVWAILGLTGAAIGLSIYIFRKRQIANDRRYRHLLMMVERERNPGVERHQAADE